MAKSMIAQKAERTPWPIDTTTPDQERGFLREMEPDDDSAAHALRAGGQVLKRYPDGRFFSSSPHTHHCNRAPKWAQTRYAPP